MAPEVILAMDEGTYSTKVNHRHHVRITHNGEIGSFAWNATALLKIADTKLIN